MKLKTVRDYSNGSLRSKIAQAATLEELDKYRGLIGVLQASGELSGSEMRKLDRVGSARKKHLESQLVHLVTPQLILDGRVDEVGLWKWK